MSEVIIMEELLKVNDKQDMNKYENSINRVSFKIEEITSNLGLDLDDQLLSEDIKNIYELLARCHKLEKAIDEACNELVNLKEAADCFEYSECPFRKECEQTMCGNCYKVKSWKEWLMRDENKN